MPIVNYEFEQLTQDEIRDNLIAALRSELGDDIDVSPNSVISSLIDMLASVLAGDVEPDLEEIYNSAFLETATGTDLDRVVEIIGIVRESAVHATGVVKFDHEEPVDQTYTIQSGTVVQTGGENSIQFETTEAALLELYDDFEDNDIDEYSEDTASFSTQSGTTYDGSNFALQGPSTDDERITLDNSVVKVGDTVSVRVNLPTNAVAQQLFLVQDIDNMMFTEVDQSGTHRLMKEVAGTETELDSETGLTITADTWLRNEIEIRLGTLSQRTVVSTLYDANGTEVSQISYTLDSSTDSTAEGWLEGEIGFGSGGANDNKYWDNYAKTAAVANIRASEGGDDGNVGANSITDMPQTVAGVNSLTNPNPTGNDEYQDTNGARYVLGQEEETDTELRNRAQESVIGGGDATHDAMVEHLLNEVEGVTSVTIYENKTDTDNTGSGGLPPHSFEAVVLGGTDEDVAEAIFAKKAVTARDYGGANGTLTTVTVTATQNEQQFDIDFSRPTPLDIDFTIDLVVTETYAGDDAVKDAIVEHVGGTRVDGTDSLGTGVGEDVYNDEVKEAILEVNGVRSITSYSTTPASTTNANSESIVDVGANEVAETDGSDSSITITTTAV